MDFLGNLGKSKLKKLEEKVREEEVLMAEVKSIISSMEKFKQRCKSWKKKLGA